MCRRLNSNASRAFTSSISTWRPCDNVSLFLDKHLFVSATNKTHLSDSGRGLRFKIKLELHQPFFKSCPAPDWDVQVKTLPAPQVLPSPESCFYRVFHSKPSFLVLKVSLFKRHKTQENTNLIQVRMSSISLFRVPENQKWKSSHPNFKGKIQTKWFESKNYPFIFSSFVFTQTVAFAGDQLR